MLFIKYYLDNQVSEDKMQLHEFSMAYMKINTKLVFDQLEGGSGRVGGYY
jgi:hypothetical protein